MNNQSEKTYTPRQWTIIGELVQTHGLDASQISFDGDDDTPIFDYEAISYLSLALTDIQKLDTWISERNEHDGFATAKCLVILPDGRERCVTENAHIGEPLPRGAKVEDIRTAEALARSRASRLGIRSVGVNLWLAHQKFVKNGETAEAHTRHSPRKPLYDEIHQLAENLELIKNGNRLDYEELIAAAYDGRRSSSVLDDIELSRFLTTLRAMDRIRRSRGVAKAA
jgi:hypothetical protein